MFAIFAIFDRFRRRSLVGLTVIWQAQCLWE